MGLLGFFGFFFWFFCTAFNRVCRPSWQNKPKWCNQNWESLGHDCYDKLAGQIVVAALIILLLLTFLHLYTQSVWYLQTMVLPKMHMCPYLTVINIWPPIKLLLITLLFLSTVHFSVEMGRLFCIPLVAQTISLLDLVITWMCVLWQYVIVNICSLPGFTIFAF